MQTSDETLIEAPPNVAFATAADIAAWPRRRRPAAENARWTLRGTRAKLGCVVQRSNSMLSKLRALLGRLAGGAGGSSEPAAPAVEYKGYRILPTPYRNNGQYQTAGTIEKDAPDGVKKHAFVRADTYASREDAIAFTITKARQIIDQQGDRMFA